MDSNFLNLVRGNRLMNYMGLQMAPEHAYKYAPTYVYVEIPVLHLLNCADGKMSDKGLRNQQIMVIPACSVTPRGSYIVEVEPNRKLAEYGTISGGIYRIHPTKGGETVVPAFAMTLRKDMDQADMEWAVRLYLIP